VTNLPLVYTTPAAWGDLVVKALRYQSEGSRIDSRWCHWIFQWHISFRPYHGPGVDSAPSENEYQEHLLGVKVAGAWGWQPHHLNVPNVMEIWEPKPPGTLWGTPGLLRDSFKFFYIPRPESFIIPDTQNRHLPAFETIIIRKIKPTPLRITTSNDLLSRPSLFWNNNSEEQPGPVCDKLPAGVLTT
jgi:hypothetical protein